MGANFPKVGKKIFREGNEGNEVSNGWKIQRTDFPMSACHAQPGARRRRFGPRNSLGGVVFRIGCYPCGGCVGELGGLVDFKQKIAAFVIRALSNAPINFKVPRTKGVI